jgi:hypothetical protein
MKKAIFILSSFPFFLYANRYKDCVLDSVKASFNESQSCQEAFLEGIPNRLANYGRVCTNKMVSSNVMNSENMKNMQEEMNENFDHDTKALIEEKLKSCGFKGDVVIENRGRKGKVTITPQGKAGVQKSTAGGFR